MKKNFNLSVFGNAADFSLPVFFGIAIIATFLVRNNPFFWDTVQLASKHAHYFFETNFESIILPQNIDSGHPPAFGMYIAAVWKIFGKTLPASHFAMLPFLLGNLFLLFKVGSHLAGKKNAGWLLLLMAVDPTFAAQSILVSPDVVLVFFFLSGLWAVFSQKRIWLVPAVLGLGMISLRGMMTGVVLFFFDIMISWTNFPKVESDKYRVWKMIRYFIKKIQPYLPGGLLALAFLIFHFEKTGWIGYHPDSPWSPTFEKVDIQGFIRNIGILGWRFLDFGRVFVWLLIIFCLIRIWKLKIKIMSPIRQLLWLTGLSILVLCPPLLIHKAITGHRYLLPVFLSVNILFFYLIFKTLPFGRWSRHFFLIALVGLFTGNLWVYPKHIAQGWDSTLAHLPYYDLRKRAIEFLDSQNIDYQKVGTAFPNIGPFENLDLNGMGEGFSEKDLSKNSLIFYSNIMNDFSDEEIETLEKDWTILANFEKRGVCVIIYEKPGIVRR